MGILSFVEGILGFGFMGLAFLMAFLGYRLLAKEVSGTGRPPVLGVIRFYMLTTIGMMIVAGILEFYKRPVDIVVHFPQPAPDGVDLPHLKLLTQTKHPNVNRDIPITITDEQQVLIVTHSLIDEIKELRMTAALQAREFAPKETTGIVEHE